MTTHRNAALMLMLCSACSGSVTEIVGSEWVKVGTFGPQGGTLTVTRDDDAALEGTQIIIPPGALSAQTTIKIGVTSQSVVASGALGPVIDFEPPGTLFALPATVTIPLNLGGNDPSRVGVMAVEPTGDSRDIRTVSVANGGASSLATFQISGFTYYGCHLEILDGGCAPACGDSAGCGSSDGCGGTCNGNCDDGGGSTTGTTTSGATAGGTSTTGGSTTGGSGGSCPAGAAWYGDTCAVSTCSAQYTGAGCLLADAGLGECLGTQCLDVSEDPAHCGNPETACAAGMTCDAGSCVGLSGCGGAGGCPAGDVCQADGRRCVPSACDAASGQRFCNGGVCCGDTCTQLDAGATCGACDVACTDGGFCSPDPHTGAPTCGDCSSAANGTVCNNGICCGGDCVDQISDGTNCGACGRTCGDGGSCSNGFCESACNGCGCDGCPSGMTCFFGSDLPGRLSVTYCVSNTCAAGQDGFQCGGSGACCGGNCLAGGFYGDPNNCGSCGNVCPTGQVCTSGVCVQTAGCSSSPSDALCLLDGGSEGMCCDGQCVDTTTTTNCTECGNACPIGSTCSSTGCSSFNCTPETCPAGTFCTSGGQCFPGCAGHEDGDYCAAEQDGGSAVFGTCCGGACLTAGDPGACGGCGLICPAGASCFAGGCELYPSFTPFECGDGGTACSDGYGCVSTNSQYGAACAPEDCKSRSNGDPCAYGPGAAGECCGGSCVLLTQDPANCGACGISCPSGVCDTAYALGNSGGIWILVPVGVCQAPLSSPTCTPDCGTGFSCVNGTCVDSLCTGDACIQENDQVGACCGNGACVDFTTDAANCGGCGLACPDGESCVSGRCQGDACSLANPGAYCDSSDATDACCGNACVDVSSDPANCGRCGVSCPVGETCTRGSCG